MTNGGWNIKERIASGKLKRFIEKKISPDKWKEYVLDFGEKKLKRNKINYDVKTRMDFSEVHTTPLTCSLFGCGKTLSLQEQLFGNRCQKHQK